MTNQEQQHAILEGLGFTLRETRGAMSTWCRAISNDPDAARRERARLTAEGFDVASEGLSDVVTVFTYYTPGVECKREDSYGGEFQVLCGWCAGRGLDEDDNLCGACCGMGVES